MPMPGSEAKTEARVGAEQANTEPVLDDLDSVDLDAPVAFDLVDPEPRAPVSAASLLVRRIVPASLSVFLHICIMFLVKSVVRWRGTPMPLPSVEYTLKVYPFPHHTRESLRTKEDSKDIECLSDSSGLTELDEIILITPKRPSEGTHSGAGRETDIRGSSELGSLRPYPGENAKQ